MVCEGSTPCSLCCRRSEQDIIVYCKLAMRHYSIDDVLPGLHRPPARQDTAWDRDGRAPGAGGGGAGMWDKCVEWGGWWDGAPRGVRSSRHLQGSAAGGETVTITEFSNGNGSADGRAHGTDRNGMARHGHGDGAPGSGTGQ
ncbi:uncharacterized protein LOC113955105 [Corapipo altera]|uniref:uncharacterized protein LOC113955105 n=1 Tax=Corapipo altera TaxID=415028 RepID=UPI000FD68858|nr:uncharacterized protein LOC113955105 [Corapipo altera]